MSNVHYYHISTLPWVQRELAVDILPWLHSSAVFEITMQFRGVAIDKTDESNLTLLLMIKHAMFLAGSTLPVRNK